ncbi:MAG: hypothetical protein CVU67_01525 [Deltaproteobacteria bacterium HGW-Deltaproteobacteria-24]|jgi:hypothetical protein|nr:MAG: hypothetical protein CVU67_01525 [Deltaproteobacteria bacterium HGW-Deltaproteobacteria-24]
MDNHEKTLDEWELKLEEQLQVLKQCQEKKELLGCEPCDAFFDCEIRKTYVVAVYESMNKGSSGGFEF